MVEQKVTSKVGENGSINEKLADTDRDASVRDEQGDEDVHVNYLTGLPLTLLTLGLCFAIFVVALDNTIIATAIPKITTVFNSLDDVEWYGSAYLLTATALQPSFGKVYSYFSVKWTYLASLALFEVGSIICAASTSSPMLILGRAVAGTGAAALFSGSMTIIAFAVPLTRRPIYVGSVASMFGIASIIGPILGGALTDKATWRWCFWINLPFGGCAFAIVLLFFKPPERDSNKLTFIEKVKKIDALGAFFLICAIVCLLLALQWGGSTLPWHAPRIWGLLLGFGLLTTVFMVIQVYRGDEATIPPRIFIRQRTVLAGSIFTVFQGMALYTHIYYLPFYFQAVKGTTAEQSGIRSIPYLVSNTTATLIIGGLITKIGWYVPFMWLSAAIFCVGSGLLFTLRVGSDAGQWIGYQIISGAGSGTGVQVPLVAVQAVLGASDIPIGTAIIMFFSSLGGAISISVAQNVFANTLIKQVPKFTTGIDPHLIVGVLVAYTYAIDRAFILPIAVTGLAFIASLFWNSVRGKDIKPGGVA